MLRRPPRWIRTYTRFPYTTLFRAARLRRSSPSRTGSSARWQRGRGGEMFLRLPAIRRPEMAAEDLVAREQAALANQKIDSHEDRCRERWREARAEMKDLRQRIFEPRLAMAQGHRRLTGWILRGQGSGILLPPAELFTQPLY